MQEDLRRKAHFKLFLMHGGRRKEGSGGLDFPSNSLSFLRDPGTCVFERVGGRPGLGS